MGAIRSRHALLLWAIGATAVVCVCLSWTFAYQAGCAGDLKSGTVGDLEVAQEFASTGASLGWLGLAVATAGVLCWQRHSWVRGIAIAIILWLLGSVGYIWMGMQFEMWGIQSCWPQHG